MRGLARHGRFLAGLAAGLAAGALAPQPPMTRLLLGGNVMFAVYLLGTAAFARGIDADELRRHAREDDEGVALILLIAVAAAAVSLAAVFDTLTGSGVPPWRRVAALMSVPLGWATLHTVFAFRYAHLWYAPQDVAGGADAQIRGGLAFEGSPRPGLTEFLYYSFTIGMTAQTSDIAVTTTPIRRLTLMHAVIAFFYNTVLIALAVSAGVAAIGA